MYEVQDSNVPPHLTSESGFAIGEEIQLLKACISSGNGKINENQKSYYPSFFYDHPHLKQPVSKFLFSFSIANSCSS
jgi:hypothetical protein